jgi:hypothetical protein
MSKYGCGAQAVTTTAAAIRFGMKVLTRPS